MSAWYHIRHSTALFVAVTAITLAGAVAANTWGGWWHLIWVVAGSALLMLAIRDWPIDDRRRGMW